MFYPADGGLPRSCAQAAAAAGEQPTGWAIAARRFIVLEVPLPWPTLIERSRELPPGLGDLLGAFEAADPDDVPRLEAIAPDAAWSVPGRVRVVLLERSTGHRPGYVRIERLLPRGEVADLVQAWVRGSVEPDPPSDARDIIVCTHGSHDTCCGRFGAPIHRALRAMTATSPNVRVWRGSHTGGHRFSPTLVDLPDGRSWARLRPVDLEALVRRSGAPSDLRDRYRGLGALPTYYERLVEAELLFEHGWSWLDRRIDGEVVRGHSFSYPEEPDELDDVATVRLSSTDLDGRREVWEARVVRGEDTVTRGECGDEPWVAPSFRVADLRPISPISAAGLR